MTFRFSTWLLISIALVSLTGCVTSPKSAKPQANWINNMHKLSVSHLRLMPIVADGKKFADPNQRDLITEELKEFALTATAIANDNKAPDADPLIAFNARSLANDAKQAYATYQVGDLQWSRFAFNRTSTYCIGCHTRADRGIKDFEVGWTTELSSLNPSQTVEFLLANRRYRSALTKATALAADTKFVQWDPRGWLLTIEKVMGMVVRVKKDPFEAEELARLVSTNPAAPSYLRRDASSWLKDIREWQKERGRETFKTAVRLVGQAQRSGPRSTAMLIPYLELPEFSMSSRKIPALQDMVMFFSMPELWRIRFETSISAFWISSTMSAVSFMSPTANWLSVATTS